MLGEATDVAIAVPPPARTRGAERRMLGWLFVALVSVLFVVQEGAVTGYDGQTMLEVTRSVVDHHSLAVDPEWNVIAGRDGKDYGRHGIGMSLVALVPYAVVSPLARASHEPEAVQEAAVSAVMPFIIAGLILALYALCRRLGSTVGAGLTVAVGSVLCTFVLPYAKEFFSEPLAALGVVLAIERALARRFGAAGAGLGLAVLARPQYLTFAPILLLVVLHRGGVRAVARSAGPLTASLLVTLGYNVARFGDPLSFGYQDQGFTTPFLHGAWGLLADPTKSVLLFAPLVLLLPWGLVAAWRLDRDAVLLIGGNLAVVFVTTATWFSWMGGWAWGPRLLIPGLLPALATVSLLTARGLRRATALLLVAGFAISLPTLLVSTQAQQLDRPPPHIGPGIARQYQLVEPSARYTAAHLYEQPPGGHNYLRYISVWQVGAARVLGRPGLLASVGGSAALLGVAGWSALRARRCYVATAASASYRV